MNKLFIFAILLFSQFSFAQENPLKACMRSLIAPRQVTADFFAAEPGVGNPETAMTALADLSVKILACENLDPSALATIPEAKREAFLKSYKYGIKAFASGCDEVNRLIQKNEMSAAKAKWASLQDFKELSHFATRFR